MKKTENSKKEVLDDDYLEPFYVSPKKAARLKREAEKKALEEKTEVVVKEEKIVPVVTEVKKPLKETATKVVKKKPEPAKSIVKVTNQEVVEDDGKHKYSLDPDCLEIEDEFETGFTKKSK